MPQSKSFAQASLAAVSGAIAHAAAIFAKAWTAYRNRRILNNLMYFDDRMLSDIGVTRGDVAASLSGGLFDDASARLTSLARERREGQGAQRREVLDELRRTPPTGGGLPTAAVRARVAA